MKFPGHITESEALKNGFTHHGSYYGLPCWMAPDNPDNPVATKWAPMECILTLFILIEISVRPILFPEDEPFFQFKIIKKINMRGYK